MYCRQVRLCSVPLYLYLYLKHIYFYYFISIQKIV
jgi:hypothetical protein